MNLRIPQLGILLAVQLGLALLLLVTGTGGIGGSEPGQPLLKFETAQVDRIELSDGKESLSLLKKDGNWQIAGDFQPPADKGKIEGFLGQLGSMERRLAVATTESAIKRFKVADDAFERRITLQAGDKKVALLYLGGSPGFRRIYARGEGDSAVYEVEFGLHQATTKVADWTDKGLLNLDVEQITHLELNGLVLDKDGENWKLAGLVEGETLDQEQAKSAARIVGTLGYQEIVGKSEAFAGDVAQTVKVGLKDGKTVELQIQKKGEEYFLQSTSQGYRFKVTKYALEDLEGLKREKMVKGGAKAAVAAPAVAVPAAFPAPAPVAAPPMPAPAVAPVPAAPVAPTAPAVSATPPPAAALPAPMAEQTAQPAPQPAAEQAMSATPPAMPAQPDQNPAPAPAGN